MTDDPTGVPRYPSTGWHETANGPVFVHAGGAIGHDGAQADDVDVAAELASVTLPEPTTDPDRLTAAYQRGGEPLRQLPARLTAPLSGLVFRSLLVPVDTTIVVWGPRGSGKSTLTRVHLQHIAPNTRFARGGLSVNHMTTKGLQRLLGQANDIPVVLDDFGVGLPSRTTTQVRDHLTRIVHSRMSFTYALAQAGQIGTTPPLRCSLIFTGETAAEGSAAARSVNLELGADGAKAVDDALLGALDTADGTAARGLIGASYIQWLAEHRATLLRRDDALRAGYVAGWQGELNRREPTEAADRLALAAADYSMGELLRLAFLAHRGVLGEEQAEEIWWWSLTGIHQAVVASSSLNAGPGPFLRDSTAFSRPSAAALLAS